MMSEGLQGADAFTFRCQTQEVKQQQQQRQQQQLGD